MKMDPNNIPSITQRLVPPTTLLPSLSRLLTYSSRTIQSSLHSLRLLYWPPAPARLPTKIFISKRTIKNVIHDDSVPDSGYASAEDDIDSGIIDTHVASDEITPETDLELLRHDALERMFAVKWVTGFVARSDIWIEASFSDEETVLRNIILDQASYILSKFSGVEDDTEVSLTRTFSFLAPESGSRIDIELNDAPLSGEDHTSVGLQSWGSSILLAERMSASPTSFSLTSAPLRVLELGAGTGLLSIVTAKLLHNSTSEIVATDYHPDVLSNLMKNVATNFVSLSTERPIAIHTLDWQFPIFAPPLDRPFDIILAADVIYHPEHAEWIKGCVENLLRQPSENEPGGVFWLMNPIRTTGRHEDMYKTVDTLFTQTSSVSRNRILAILSVENIERRGNIGRADEGGYKLYKIGWIDSTV